MNAFNGDRYSPYARHWIRQSSIRFIKDVAETASSHSPLDCSLDSTGEAHLALLLDSSDDISEQLV